VTGTFTSDKVNQEVEHSAIKKVNWELKSSSNESVNLDVSSSKSKMTSGNVSNATNSSKARKKTKMLREAMHSIQNKFELNIVKAEAPTKETKLNNMKFSNKPFMHMTANPFSSESVVIDPMRQEQDRRRQEELKVLNFGSIRSAMECNDNEFGSMDEVD